MNHSDTKLRMLPALALAAVLAIGACGNAPTEPLDGVPPGASIVAAQEVFSLQSQWSGYEQPIRLLISTAADWAAAWATIHRGVTPQPPLPAVDFGSNVLLLAAMGQRPSGGHTVHITRVHANADVLHATVSERTPGANCVVTGALTAPVHVVQVPRQGSRAEFNVTRAVRNC